LDLPDVSLVEDSPDYPYASVNKTLQCVGGQHGIKSWLMASADDDLVKDAKVYLNFNLYCIPMVGSVFGVVNTTTAHPEHAHTDEPLQSHEDGDYDSDDLPALYHSDDDDDYAIDDLRALH
jgi:hypothetical protein